VINIPNCFVDMPYANFTSNKYSLPVLPLCRYGYDNFFKSIQYEFYREREFLKASNHQFYQSVDKIDAADFILMPLDYSRSKKVDPNICLYYENLSKQSNKILILFHFGDGVEDINVPNSIIFRHSKYKNTLGHNEIICPPLINNLSNEHEFQCIDNFKDYSVGFVGHGVKMLEDLPPWKKFFQYAKKDYMFSILGLFNSSFLAHRSGMYFRKKTVNILRNSGISTNFLLRRFWGRGRDVRTKGLSDEFREEFIKSIDINLFNLSIRGVGNYSFRFYEIISAGRIPVLIDTLCPLPMEDKINYDDFCVIVNHSDLKNTPDIIASWYKSKTNKQLVESQKKAKKVFKENLDFIVFFDKFFKNEIFQIIDEKKIRKDVW
jgi:hypothetical protein